MKPVIVLAVALLLASLATAEVKKGTAASFDSIISNKLVLVKFYAPWCGHCKKLAPEFEKASELTDEAVLAEVDCTVEKDVCGRFSIEGYPTLIVFREGKESEKYAGSRDAKGIAAYLNAQVGPAVKTAKSAAELQKLKDSSASLCVIMSKSDDTILANAVNQIAEQMRATMTFVLVTDQSVSPDDAMESLVVHRAGGEKESYAGPVILSNIEKFLKTAPIPFFGEINPETFSMYVSQNEKPVGWVFLSKDTREELKKTMIEVARKHRDTLFLCWVNADLYGGLGQQMALPANTKYPAFVIGLNRIHYVQPQNVEVNEESISQFIEKYAKGEVSPTLRSEEIPAVETENGLTTLVGKTISKYDGKKDVFIMFHAPWCGHCKTLLPEYEKMAKEFESANVIIAKVDATVNDMDRKRFDVTGFPTLYFVPAGKDPISYNGERTFDGLVAFVKQHATDLQGGADESGDL